MATVYFDCSLGISGDMTVAALLDAGADRGVLQEALDSISCGGFRTEISTVMKNGIAALDFNVVLEHENHDHDMEFLFGEKGQHHYHAGIASEEQHGGSTRNDGGEEHHDSEGSHLHHHNDDGANACNSSSLDVGSAFASSFCQAKTGKRVDREEVHHHCHEHHHEHHHEHRCLKEIFDIIDGTKMTDGAKELAKKIFDILAEAESKAHAKPKDDVHFHEVGALDSIVDIISIAVCFDNLHIDRVYATPLTEGFGTIRCAHGILSVPVPAVANILSAYKIPLSIKNERGEFVTPTGAAFLAAVEPIFDAPKNVVIQKIGQGAGKRAYENPSILRALILEEKNELESDVIAKLECNIDDCTGESLGFVQETLFAEGALDVSFVPCFMKKNRPAFLLQVICNSDDVQKYESLIFEHTTTIGIRRVNMERTKLVRRPVEIDTEWGKIRGKEVVVNGKTRVYPEYESVKEVCKREGVSFFEAMKKCGK